MNEEILEKMLHERISLIHGEQLTPQEKGIIHEGEQAIQEMEEGKRAKVEAYLDLLSMKDMDAEARAYTAGFEDAAWLIGRLYKITEGKNI